ncbi:cation:proton antiporter [Paracoccus aerodenitrificans]|uniref:cation:proton antiporter n=1 Tax=Paracoccus aerodenitrificans TaxID=3017781 RepID=UPI0022F04338|nr:cation:proton antiporter [Paracoccus aerodenitrificans]WBU65382.1 cation:proton antiporter [Paracoccus aerodenitrificans]
MDIVVITAIIASLFLLIGLAEPLAIRLRLPFSVVLALLGVIIATGASFLLTTTLTNAFNEQAAAVLMLPIRSNVFLYIFLPTLIFQAVLEMNLRRMADDWVPILVLAVVAVLVATVFVGTALSWTGEIPVAAAFLIGSIVSTTDPSAVVAIFRSLAAPRRLARIIEGESLLNDAAAIALFSLFMGFVMRGIPDPTIGTALMQLPVLMLGGALIGLLAGRAAVAVMALVSEHELAVISISIALPYLSFIAAEQSGYASGVIAVVTSAMTLNFLGPAKMSPGIWSNLRQIWATLAHWAGALIFILAALLIPRLLGDATLRDAALIAIVVLAAFLARAVILWGVLPVLTLLRLSPEVQRPYRVAILWGGLRGAVTLALALAVTESAFVPPDVKRQVGIMATGFTLFTLFVQGTTLRRVIKRLGLSKLSPLDAALSNQVIAVALQQVREDMAQTAESYRLTRQTVRSEAKRFAERLNDAVTKAEESDAILDRDRVTLGLIALAGAEREMVLKAFHDREISARILETVLTEADRVMEGARHAGRVGYARAGRHILKTGPGFRLALILHNRFGLSRRLERLTADRFEVLVAQRQIIAGLHGFLDRRIRRIHGRRVADLLHEMLARRLEEVEQALEGMRLQFPEFAEDIERRMIRRTALRLEEREYESFYEDGLIGAELFMSLNQDISARRQRFESRPHLDLAVQKLELVRSLPVFAGLDDAALKTLSRALVTRYAAPGQIIQSKETAERAVFFISSGAVQIETAGGHHRLGRGEMFGQMNLLMKRTPRTEIRAIAPSTLLRLDEERFRSLLKRSPSLRQAVRDAAIKRGIDPEKLDLAA